ncbi:hypothetical protein LWI29_030343 [Acer saccharum]|uniref:Transmembrane protein n=1 Tax=Acer saccharum TaxID=4024 RepID=A0AA39VME6_ACESA|nr:hypothetical protein LWI29_030343 [Acer saccharum]
MGYRRSTSNLAFFTFVCFLLVVCSSQSHPTPACDRVEVLGHSRLKLGSYVSSFRVIAATLHGQIRVCIHGNASLGLCQCEKDEWKAGVEKGNIWSSVMSPFEDKYVDVKCVSKTCGPVSVEVEEHVQRWRLFFLASGFLLFVLAPIVSKRVPFYYSFSALMGVLFVIVFLIFQGMKLLGATRRNNVFHNLIHASLFGAAYILFGKFSMLVDSFDFGLNKEMNLSAYILLLVGIILVGGAFLGICIARMFIISKDGTVDDGLAQFVKWSIRIIATASIYMGTLDVASTVYCLCLVTCPNWLQDALDVASTVYCLCVAGVKRLLHQLIQRTQKLGHVQPVFDDGDGSRQIYLSTFHKKGPRRRFTKQEWEDFTGESTQQALAQHFASPEFTGWMIEHAQQIKLFSPDTSDTYSTDGNLDSN